MRQLSRHEMLALALFVMFLAGTTTFAGTGGSELSSIWTEISNGLQGFWGKIIAVIFIGLTLVAAKGGNMLMAFAMFVLAMVVGVAPGVIDARYTLTFLGY